MRLLILLAGLACWSCTNHPTAEEQALVSRVERIVKLPKGGGELKCYERHYALLQGTELDQYVGVRLFPPDRKVLVGVYRLGGKPGVHWAANANELPPKMMDGGCLDIGFFHVVGDEESRIEVSCSTTIAGVPPDEVVPPVAC